MADDNNDREVADSVLAQEIGLQNLADRAVEFLSNYEKIRVIFARLGKFEQAVAEERSLLTHLIEARLMGEWEISTIFSATSHALEEQARAKRKRPNEGVDRLKALITLCCELGDAEGFDDEVTSRYCHDSPLLSCLVAGILRALPSDDIALREAFVAFADSTRRGLDRDGCATSNARDRKRLLEVFLPRALAMLFGDDDGRAQ